MTAKAAGPGQTGSLSTAQVAWRLLPLFFTHVNQVRVAATAAHSATHELAKGNGRSVFERTPTSSPHL
jgi:hypothetical protein